MALKRNRPSTNCIRSLPLPSSPHPLPRTSLLPRGALAISAELGRMEHFHDGEHVWLRCRERGTYLHADQDGRGLILCSERASRNAAWKVQVFYEDGIMLFLQSAAYGRYLAATDLPAPTGHPGLLTAQRDFTNENAESIMWLPVESGSGDDVLLLHISGTDHRYLRANGRYVFWQTSVTVEDVHNLHPMMHWVVEPIPPRDTIPPLQRPYGSPAFIAFLRRIAEEHSREIRYVRAGEDGIVNENDWVAFQYAGRSVLSLRSELARRLELDETAVFTMCARAGRYARLTPLVVDLPICEDPVDIVILMDGNPAMEELQHQDIDLTDDED